MVEIHWDQIHGVALDFGGVLTEKGAADFLEFLCEREIPFAICSTDSIERVISKLNGTGLQGYFSDQSLLICFAAMFKGTNDYARVSQVLGVQTQELLVLDDTLQCIQNAAEIPVAEAVLFNPQDDVVERLAKRKQYSDLP